MVAVNWEKLGQDRHEAWALQIAVAFSLPHARTYLAEIQSAQEKIAIHPNIGADFEFGRANLKRFVTPSGYSIFYQVDHQTKPTMATIIAIVRGQESL